MYVSHGLGAKHPLRWNCRPELTRLTLRRAAVHNQVGLANGAALARV
jgi:hypothetical protein